MKMQTKIMNILCNHCTTSALVNVVQNASDLPHLPTTQHLVAE